MKQLGADSGCFNLLPVLSPGLQGLKKGGPLDEKEREGNGLMEKVWTLVEGDKVKSPDGIVFTIKKIAKDIIILQSIKDNTQVLTGKRGLMLYYQKVTRE